MQRAGSNSANSFRWENSADTFAPQRSCMGVEQRAHTLTISRSRVCLQKTQSAGGAIAAASALHHIRRRAIISDGIGSLESLGLLIGTPQSGTTIVASPVRKRVSMSRCQGQARLTNWTLNTSHGCDDQEWYGVRNQLSTCHATNDRNQPRPTLKSKQWMTRNITTEWQIVSHTL